MLSSSHFNLELQVKSTKTASKRSFEVSPAEMRKAAEQGGRYHVYRIYEAGAPGASIMVLVDPALCWEKQQVKMCMFV